MGADTYYFGNKKSSSTSIVISNIAEQAIQARVNKIRDKVKASLDNVRRVMQSFLKNQSMAKSLPFPNKISGNLMDNLIWLRVLPDIEEVPVIKIGNKHTASIRIDSYLGVDWHGNHTVFNKRDGAPYAHILNYNDDKRKRFANYQGYYDRLQKVFHNRISKEIKSGGI
jgi:hypothetical protein